MNRFSAILLALTASLSVGESITGRWDAAVRVDEQYTVPFRLELAQHGSKAVGTLFNGEERISSTSGTFEHGSLTLKFSFFGSNLDAKLVNGEFSGTYDTGRKRVFGFSAKRFAPVKRPAEKVPSISGIWQIQSPPTKREAAWRFIVKQSGADVSAAILRVDGDTGALTGTYRDGKFVLSHFSGVRPSLLEVTLADDGTLQMVRNGAARFTAVREDQAKEKGLPGPADPSDHTRLKDASKPLAFRFPDLNGKVISNEDPQFKGRVVLVNIAGSWCPNCHDEAPFLAALYKKYHSQGLEIVALSFEEGDQLKDPQRLRAFVAKYGIEYTVLLCGEPSEAAEKLSQAENWDSWPTTFFVGRDGLVHGVHAGFPSSASGELFREAKSDFTAEVERLLAEKSK